MNISIKIEGEIVSNTLKIAPFNKYYHRTVDHAPGSPSKYMTTIYNYFCIKMIFLDFLKVKKIMKICSKTYQIAPLKIFLGEKHAPEPP